VMLPVLVIVNGVLDAVKCTCPLTAVLIVWPAIAFLPDFLRWTACGPREIPNRADHQGMPHAVGTQFAVSSDSPDRRLRCAGPDLRDRPGSGEI
jgi:hypothetical protein